MSAALSWILAGLLVSGSASAPVSTVVSSSPPASSGPTFAVPCRTPDLFPLPGVPSHTPKAGRDTELLIRDAIGSFPSVRTTQHFALKWGDELTVTDETVNQLLSSFEYSWTTEVSVMQHAAPLGTDQYKFNIYIGDSGSGAPSSLRAAGYYYVDSESWPMIVVAPKSLEHKDVIEHVSAHEFYHAIQHASGSYQDYDVGSVSAWYWEATAESMAGQVYPKNPTYFDFLFGFAFLPHLSLNLFDYPDRRDLTEYHQYGAFIFPHFISEHVASWKLVRDSWVNSQGISDPLVVVDSLLAVQSDNLADTFGRFAAHNAVWDYADGRLYKSLLNFARGFYSDQSVAATVTTGSGSNTWVSPPTETLPQRYGYNVISFHSPARGTLHAAVLADARGSQGSNADFRVTLVRDLGTRLEYVELPRIAAGADSSVEVSVEVSTADAGDFSDYLVVAATPSAAEAGEKFGYQYRLGVSQGSGKEGGGCAAQGTGQSSATTGAPLLVVILMILAKRRSWEQRIKPGGDHSGMLPLRLSGQSSRLPIMAESERHSTCRV